MVLSQGYVFDQIFLSQGYPTENGAAHPRQSFFRSTTPGPATQGWKMLRCMVHGSLDRYVKLRVAHAPGMSRMFSPPPWVSDPQCVTHVPWCMPGSLISGFLWSRRWGNRTRHSRRMRNPQFYVSGTRPIGTLIDHLCCKNLDGGKLLIVWNIHQHCLWLPSLFRLSL